MGFEIAYFVALMVFNISVFHELTWGELERYRYVKCNLNCFGVPDAVVVLLLLSDLVLYELCCPCELNTALH